MTSSAEPTLLLSPDDFDSISAEVTGDRYRHLFRARRLAVADPLRVVDGTGRARRGRVERVDGSSATVALGDGLPSLEPGLEVVLLVGSPRKERASWLVEKATELGVAEVHFVACERSPREFGPGTLDRWRRVAEAAVAQCGRARLPTVGGVHPWADVPGVAGRGANLQVLVPGGAPLQPAGRPPSRSALLIGPEGGLTASEQEEAREWGAVAAGLGRRTLRVETAALAAAAILLHSDELR